MKNIKIIISAILLVVMATLTASGYFLKANLARGDMESMEDIAAVNGAWPAIFLVISGFLLFYYLSQPTKVKLAFLGITIILWLLSGRMISMIFWPDGKLTTGWFSVPTEKFSLCNGKTNCETIMAYHTKTENLFFWRIRIKNENVDKIVFVGPFLWSKTVRLLHDEIGNGTYPKK